MTSVMYMFAWLVMHIFACLPFDSMAPQSNVADRWLEVHLLRPEVHPILIARSFEILFLSLDGSKVLELRSNDTHSAINSTFPGHGHEGDPVSKLILRC